MITKISNLKSKIFLYFLLNNIFLNAQWDLALKEHYVSILWASYKGFRAANYFCQFNESSPYVSYSFATAEKYLKSAHSHMVNSNSKTEIALITAGLTATFITSTYINYKISKKVAATWAGCDGSCKKQKDKTTY